jgi:uncharacterized membrane protein (DUF106 family)
MENLYSLGYMIFLKRGKKMVNWVGVKEIVKAHEEAERKKRLKLLKKIKEKRNDFKMENI